MCVVRVVCGVCVFVCVCVRRACVLCSFCVCVCVRDCPCACVCRRARLVWIGVCVSPQHTQHTTHTQHTHQAQAFTSTHTHTLTTGIGLWHPPSTYTHKHIAQHTAYTTHRTQYATTDTGLNTMPKVGPKDPAAPNVMPKRRVHFDHVEHRCIARARSAGYPSPELGRRMSWRAWAASLLISAAIGAKLVCWCLS